MQDAQACTSNIYLFYIINCYIYCFFSKASSIVRSVALAFKSVGKLLKEKRERILLEESSLCSSDRIRTDSDGSRYRERNRTESEGSRDKNKINNDANNARKKQLPLSACGRNKNGNQTAAYTTSLQNEETVESGTKTEVIVRLRLHGQKWISDLNWTDLLLVRI